MDPTKSSPFGARGTRVLCSPYFCYGCHLTMASRRPSRSAGIYRSVLPLSWSISTVDSTNAENCCVKTSSENLINEKDELTDLISDN